MLYKQNTLNLKKFNRCKYFACFMNKQKVRLAIILIPKNNHHE